MTNSNFFEIKKYDFNEELVSKISPNLFVSGLWPLVYILSDGTSKTAYVGETTDAIVRMSAHLKHNKKNKLTAVHLLTSDKFNKSATLDIESNLIKYLHGDGQYTLLNANLGLANHTYYQKKEIYWDIFQTVWNELKVEGLTCESLEQINNSDLFKYSPFKSLSSEQRASLINILKSLLNKSTDTILVQGGAGTGKTILAIFLFKLLNTSIDDIDLRDFGEEEGELIELIHKLKKQIPNPKMALVIPMGSFRNTLKKVFSNIKGLRANMVIGPAEVTRSKYDIIIVDESHRLRQRVNLGTYFGAFDKANLKLHLKKETGNELDWVTMQSKKLVLFYDVNQSVKPSDVKKEDFLKIINNKKTVVEVLNSQFRVKGGNDYIAYVNKLLQCEFRKEDKIYKSKSYEFVMFDSLRVMIDKIKENNQEYGLSRLVAGYSWKWVSRNKNIHDIEIEDIKLKWNSVEDDWVNSPNSINEVGCIHTTQGYDLNYTGLIFGKEISYHKVKNEIYIKKENYHDRNGKHSDLSSDDLKKYIINIYKTLMSRGIKGTYVYVCDLDLREYFKKHMVLDIAPQSDNDPKKVISPYKGNTISVPWVGSAPCGNPLLGQENIEQSIEVEESKIKKGFDYFILQAQGNSMNLAGINDGDLVLCRQQLKAETGDRVVALLGDNVTIKMYDKKDGVRILRPHSTDKSHKPIVPQDGDTVQGVVQEVL